MADYFLTLDDNTLVQAYRISKQEDALCTVMTKSEQWSEKSS